MDQMVPSAKVVRLVLQDYRATPEPQEKQERSDPQDPKENKATRERPVSKDFEVNLDQLPQIPEQSDNVVPMVTVACPERTDNLVALVLLDDRDLLDHRVHQDVKELKETAELRDHQEQTVNQDDQGFQESKELLDEMVHQENPDNRVKKVHQD